jgi:hypothetical protein
MWKRYVRYAIGWMVFVTYHDLKFNTLEKRTYLSRRSGDPSS